MAWRTAIAWLALIALVPFPASLQAQGPVGYERLLNAVKEDPSAKRKGSRAARQAQWQKDVAADPWLAESLRVMHDMLGSGG